MSAVPGYPRLRYSGGALNPAEQRVSSSLLAALEAVAQKLGVVITIFSGSGGPNVRHAGFVGDPHQQGVAVDANINGRPIGLFPGAVSALHAAGLRTGATDFTYQGKADPAHVDTLSSYPNAWPGWAQAVLAAAKLPVTPANITFLNNWHAHEGSKARFNPLNVGGFSGGGVNTYGLGAINSDGVQTYANAQQGIRATVAFLNMPNYTAIRNGLASGDIYAYSAKSSDNADNIALALKKWGSTNFAVVFRYEAPTSAAADTVVNQAHFDPTTNQPVQSQTKGPDPGGIFSGLISWVEGYAIRTAEVVGGFVMLLVGLYLLARQIGLAPTAPAPIERVAGAVT